MNKAIMCHVVAGYPNPEDCLKLMLGMQRSGVEAIEVQIPFSDPIADGETIMEANDGAILNGMTTASSFELIEKARSQGLNIDLYVMSYVQKVRHFGLEQFCERAAKSLVKGFIIPDLPYDSDEFHELYQLLEKQKLSLIPVLSPGMLDYRLQAILAYNPPAVYITSKQGITGKEYAPAAELKQFVDKVRKTSKARIMIGFGIANPRDVDDALQIGDMAVVGSAVIKKTKASGVNEAIEYVRSLVSV